MPDISQLFRQRIEIESQEETVVVVGQKGNDATSLRGLIQVRNRFSDQLIKYQKL